ncbi:MAG: cation transporting ATPase C-terminal domain-containing protein, partial [Acidobacteriota bacterium]
TIVEAVAEGRRIFANIRKFIRYLLSSNAGEVLTMFAGILGAGLLGLDRGDGGFFLPLLAVQILWINLVTDGAPALALGVDPGGSGLMNRPPRHPKEPVIDRPMWWMIGAVGLVMMAGTLFVLDAYLPAGLIPPLAFLEAGGADLVHARTAAFTTLVMFQMVNVFNCLSPTESLFSTGPFRNRWLVGAVTLSVALHALVIYWPPLQTAFETTALSVLDWVVAVAVALSVIGVGEVAKLVRRRLEG